MHALVAAMLASAALTTNPVHHVTTDRVELMELNHFYDDEGKHVFDQLLFYEWSPLAERYQIRDWRLLKSASQGPIYDARRGDYVATWHDGLTLRRVRASELRETWTQYDPELTDRSHLPKELRRELSAAAQPIKR